VPPPLVLPSPLLPLPLKLHKLLRLHKTLHKPLPKLHRQHKLLLLLPLLLPPVVGVLVRHLPLNPLLLLLHRRGMQGLMPQDKHRQTQGM
jgi:hypothetical protein